jgi:hypothetical protein
VTRQRQQARLRVLYFDATAGDEPRSVTREHALGKNGERDQGDGAATSWDALLPALLRELLGEPSESKPAAAPLAAEPSADEGPTSEDAAASEAPAPATDGDTTRAAPADSDALPLGPLLLGAGGLAAVTAGLITGAIMRGTENDYAKRMIDSPEQARLAEQERKRGKSQALVASVLLGVGAGAIVAAGAWLVLDLRSQDGPAHAALSPWLQGDGAGLVVSAAWEPSP